MHKAAFAAVAFLAPALARADHVWGVGLRTTTQHIAPPKGEAGDEIHLAGGGLQARWRFARAFGVELALEGLRGDLGDGYRRESSSGTISLMWHLTPARRWDLYLLLGLGGVGDKVTGAERTEEMRQRLVCAGVGVELLWTHIGVGVELRGVALAREDSDGAPMLDVVPAKSGAAQASVTASYYF